MKYFKDIQTGEVFAFDETDETQLPYMQAKIDAGLEDITGAWPLPEPEVIEQPASDPVDKLKAFLADNPDVAAILK